MLQTDDYSTLRRQGARVSAESHGQEAAVLPNSLCTFEVLRSGG
jgi:hypothetical protein